MGIHGLVILVALSLGGYIGGYSETVEKNVYQKYSFDNVGVEEFEYGNVLIAHCVVHDYGKNNSFEVKMWVDPVASEPAVRNTVLVSDRYASEFVGL